MMNRFSKLHAGGDDNLRIYFVWPNAELWGGGGGGGRYQADILWVDKCILCAVLYRLTHICFKECSHRAIQTDNTISVSSSVLSTLANGMRTSNKLGVCIIVYFVQRKTIGNIADRAECTIDQGQI